jgi:uncharacterized protein YeaO (DUF488 family)
MTYQGHIGGAPEPVEAGGVAMRVHLKRVYDPIEPNDGRRVLVDRLWPRGVKEESLKLHEWLKDVGPSTTLRRWFGHDSERWLEFRRRYFAELDAKPDLIRSLMDMAIDGSVTLLYSARDQDHNQAVALKQYLEEHSQDQQAATLDTSPRDVARSAAVASQERRSSGAATPRNPEEQTDPTRPDEEQARDKAEPAPPKDDWDTVLQASWESFPASDAPGWR